ncbi:MFS transporter [Kitasatospora purpeofusca]|uniref:MFS transporter n=1 Tax=Kitasatospora purpeofusca TaxID=67352 RepID=UPI0038693761
MELVPTVLLGLYGGVLADRADRRRVVLATEIAPAALSALLLNALAGEPVLWPLYLAAGCAAALQGLQQPSLEAMVPRLVPHDQLMAAGALLSLRWSTVGLAAPAAAGVVIATTGVAGHSACSTRPRPPAPWPPPRPAAGPTGCTGTAGSSCCPLRRSARPRRRPRSAPGSGRSCSAWRSPAPRTGWATPSGPPSGTARSWTGSAVARPGRSC